MPIKEGGLNTPNQNLIPFTPPPAPRLSSLEKAQLIEEARRRGYPRPNYDFWVHVERTWTLPQAAALVLDTEPTGGFFARDWISEHENPEAVKWFTETTARLCDIFLKCIHVGVPFVCQGGNDDPHEYEPPWFIVGHEQRATFLHWYITDWGLVPFDDPHMRTLMAHLRRLFEEVNDARNGFHHRWTHLTALPAWTLEEAVCIACHVKPTSENTALLHQPFDGERPESPGVLVYQVASRAVGTGDIPTFVHDGKLHVKPLDFLAWYTKQPLLPELPAALCEFMQEHAGNLAVDSTAEGNADTGQDTPEHANARSAEHREVMVSAHKDGNVVIRSKTRGKLDGELTLKPSKGKWTGEMRLVVFLAQRFPKGATLAEAFYAVYEENPTRDSMKGLFKRLQSMLGTLRRKITTAGLDSDILPELNTGRFDGDTRLVFRAARVKLGGDLQDCRGAGEKTEEI